MLSPALVALVGSSALSCAMVTAAALAGLTAAAGWNPDDNGARQLARERRLLLVEAVVKMVLGCQLASLWLFLIAVEGLHPFFTGAMCAAGTLEASRFGYPTLGVKLAVFLLCGLWLVVDRASQGAVSTGLVRFKHLSVVAAAAALVAENILQCRYFADLDPEIITSCCAKIFNASGSGIGSELAALPGGASRAAFFTLLGLTLGAGSWGRGRMPGLYSLLAVGLGLVSAAAVVSWVAPSFYQLPSHHCPFCLLASHQGYVGYPLYLFLAIAVVAGVGAGVVRLLRGLDSSRDLRPGEERRLCLVSMAGFALFALVAVWPMVTSDLRLEGF